MLPADPWSAFGSLAGGALQGAPSSAFTGSQESTGPDLSGWSVATGGGSVNASRGEPATLLAAAAADPARLMLYAVGGLVVLLIVRRVLK